MTEPNLRKPTEESTPAFGFRISAFGFPSLRRLRLLTRKAPQRGQSGQRADNKPPNILPARSCRCRTGWLECRRYLDYFVRLKICHRPCAGCELGVGGCGRLVGAGGRGRFAFD